LFSLEAAAPARTVTLLSGLSEGRGGALAEFLAGDLAKMLNRPVELRSHPEGSGVRAAIKLMEADPGERVLGLLTAEVAITRTLTMASPYAPEEILGRLVVFEEPWALVAGVEAPFSNLSELAAASLKAPLSFGELNLGFPALSSLQAMGIFKSAGARVETKPVASLDPSLLIGSEPQADLLALPLSLVRRDKPGPAGVKIVAVLADGYEGPCASKALSLSNQKLKLPVRNLAALYEREGPKPPDAESLVEAAALVLEKSEARSLLAESCLIASEAGLSASPRLLSEEFEAQEALLASLGLSRDR
jgi:hypothetical protein